MVDFHLLHLNALPIYEQLQIEEALLRTDERNWCLINTNAPHAIVMGISGKPEALLNQSLVNRDRVPLIKRYSGGGTVYIDEETLFVSFICNSKCLDVEPFPQALMQWSYRFYSPFFSHPLFELRENDYVMGEHKCGGNAQYIQKLRWVHHTSFLWDYNPEKMQYLRLPEKRPRYRGERSHSDFLCTLKSYYPNKENLISRLKDHLKKSYEIKESSLEGLEEVLQRPHRKSTGYL